MYILLNLFPASGARKTEHIITHHMPPVKSGKSYFLSGETNNCALGEETP